MERMILGEVASIVGGYSGEAVITLKSAESARQFYPGQLLHFLDPYGEPRPNYGAISCVMMVNFDSGCIRVDNLPSSATGGDTLALYSYGAELLRNVIAGVGKAQVATDIAAEVYKRLYPQRFGVAHVDQKTLEASKDNGAWQDLASLPITPRSPKDTTYVPTEAERAHMRELGYTENPATAGLPASPSAITPKTEAPTRVPCDCMPLMAGCKRKLEHY